MYQPVDSGKISQTDVQEFAKYYNELPKPILMICRSGSRSTALFNQAKAQGLLDMKYKIWMLAIIIATFY